MSKLNLTDLSTITGNETSAINTINNNSALIETFSDNTISRDGTTPNTMLDDFDMNSNRILNLPTPASALEPLRLQDLSDFIGSGTITTGAPTNASYVTLGTNATLSAERVLTAGTNITLTDAGAGSTLTVSAPTLVVGPGSATDTAIVKFNSTTGKLVQNTGVLIDSSNNINPATNDAGALGTSSLKWSDLFLASGGVINWNNNNVNCTHSNNALVYGGVSNGIFIDGPINIAYQTAVPAGGSGGIGYRMSSNPNLGIYFGSGAPSLSAAHGSLYLRTDGGVNARLYINTNDSTGWATFNTLT